MTAAIYHGKAITAYYNATAFSNVLEWSCTITADTAESQVQHQTTWGKTREVGFKAGTATVTTRLPGDSEVTEGATFTLELWRDATSASKGYSGLAICTGIDVGVDKDSIETMTYSFQYTGTIANTLAAA